jgi:serine/threonine protein kinase
MDLAARNVLVDSALICKVCDFGLTRPIDRKLGYFKQTQSMKLPVKWMALESITQRIFSEKTDVWSMGITIWEIMNYGKVPYEGVRNVQVQSHLENGARAPRPSNCPVNIYAEVEKCFIKDPSTRPNFEYFVSSFTRLFVSNGGLDGCRDIGAALTGGAERKPSMSASTKPAAGGGIASRKQRAMSIMQSPNIKQAHDSPFQNAEDEHDSDDDWAASAPKRAPTTGDMFDSDDSSDIDLDAPDMRTMPAKKQSFTLQGPGGGGEDEDGDIDLDTPSGAMHSFNGSNATLTENSVGLACTIRKIDSPGVIKWVGLHHTNGQPRILVELAKPLGQNDGSLNGHMYARCRPKHGVLAPPASVTVTPLTGNTHGNMPDQFFEAEAPKKSCCTIL